MIPYISNQCKDIEKSSKGRVRARFMPLVMVKRTTATGAAAAIAAYASASGFAGGTVTEEKDLLPQEDINKLYEPRTYAFDLYNDTYKFRVLTMELGAMYPVQVELDPGIADGLGDNLEGYEDMMGMAKGIWIQNDKELSEFIEMLATSSAKLKHVLRRLASGE
ncbi:hypothetical protein [Paratractidigestivibacter sp.]|uniref:hypothetical protein n=2 Tax=Paratractidigestivibacter sp. TaxID=2847316 RepID=UPI002AC98B9E|nr:hypothetical protein [Paratractidigestivibacter sp.]